MVKISRLGIKIATDVDDNHVPSDSWFAVNTSLGQEHCFKSKALQIRAQLLPLYLSYPIQNGYYSFFFFHHGLRVSLPDFQWARYM